MFASTSYGLVEVAVAGNLQEVPVDDGRAGLAFSKLTMAAGTQKMVL